MHIYIYIYMEKIYIHIFADSVKFDTSIQFVNSIEVEDWQFNQILQQANEWNRQFGLKIKFDRQTELDIRYKR